jgi:hypothetical protein
MREREFPIAEKHAQLAIDMFHEIGDRHGEAEAVHRLGLIEMQRGNMESAHELFDRSLEVDRAAGERTFFRGEYERHVGFVLMHRGDFNALSLIDVRRAQSMRACSQQVRLGPLLSNSADWRKQGRTCGTG